MIIFINGSINSGKSTIAKILARRLPRPANLEIDTLDDFIDWLPLSESNPINLENAVSLIRNFEKHGFNVIVPYPLSNEDWHYLRQQLTNMQLHVFLLRPTLDVAQSDRGRELSEREISRVREMYEENLIMDVGLPIDNSNQTPEQTAELILQLVESGKSLNANEPGEGDNG